MLQDRVIYDNAVNAKEHEFRLLLEAVERIRSYSFEMQRSIEALVEARDHARGEVAASRRSDEEMVEAIRDARGKVSPRLSGYVNSCWKRSKSWPQQSHRRGRVSTRKNFVRLDRTCRLR